MKDYRNFKTRNTWSISNRSLRESIARNEHVKTMRDKLVRKKLDKLQE